MTMGRRSQVKTWVVWADDQDLAGSVPQPARRSRAAGSRSWIREPKAAVWIILCGVALVGGGRKLLASWNARRAINRLGEVDVAPAEIEAAADHGRAGVWELLRLFALEEPEAKRFAAGRALARLWRDDQLVAEEEQAVIRRGFRVDWRARRRYPRDLAVPIPIVANYHVPFLRDDGRSVGPGDLEWSHRATGARRAALEQFTPWAPGPGRARIEIIPGDFETSGPHRLVLEIRVRTRGRTPGWEIALPHMPFSFELTRPPTIESILTLPDETRKQAIEQAVALEPGEQGETLGADVFLALDSDFMIRNPPRITVAGRLPCDLAHAVELEIEGVPGLFPAGRVVLAGQGPASFELGPVAAAAGLIDRAGARKARAVLTADPSSGWADPDVRSVWPGPITTNWALVDVVRR